MTHPTDPVAAQPDPRDEALRLAREAMTQAYMELKDCVPRSRYKRNLDELMRALAAIDALKE